MGTHVKAAATRALDTQLDFIRNYESDYGKRLVSGFIESMVDKKDLDQPEYMTSTEYAQQTGQRIAQELTENLGVAPTYYLTDEMMDLTLHAGQNIPDVRFHEQDLPSSNGFLLLPRPLVTIDRNNKPMTARSLAWWVTDVRLDGPDRPAVTAPALMFCLFSNKTDWRLDHAMQDVRENHPKMWLLWQTWQLCHWAPIYFVHTWGKTDDGDTIGVKLGENKKDPTSYVGDGQQDSFYAFLRTFFLLVKQKVAVIHSQHPDRAGARRWASAGLIPEMGTMQIVTLRKERPPTMPDEDEGDPSVWSHRWVVSGHWRNQWYPKLNDHVPVWIASYVKGPEDKPLIVKDKVFVWKR